LIVERTLSEEIEEEFRKAKQTAFRQVVTLRMRIVNDQGDVLKLIDVELKIK